MKLSGGLTLAILMVAVGAIWTFQGLGYLGGSFMTGESLWAILGPIVAGLGLALGIVLVQNGRNGDGRR
ncbi:hypothetical protein [Nocardioides sp.]|uniref:hypothetical protein n=1 Tax=Nocardioides sp. TaxID=35761 RepID=UPI003516C90E